MATNRLVEMERLGVYASTLFDAVNAAGGEEMLLEVRNQFFDIIRAMNSDMSISDALTSSEYTPEERGTLARAAFADCNEGLRETIAVMAQNGDADNLIRVYHLFEDEMKAKLNTVVVDVTTVVPLDDELRKLIKEKTEADLGCRAVLNESIDKAILGGIIMSVNGKRIDASVISQLNKARHVLKETDGGESK